MSNTFERAVLEEALQGYSVAQGVVKVRNRIEGAAWRVVSFNESFHKRFTERFTESSNTQLKVTSLALLCPY